MLLTKQLLNHWPGIPGPFVQWDSTAKLNIYDSLDRIKPVSRRFKLSSRRPLCKEQLRPWNLVQLQDGQNQHRELNKYQRGFYLTIFVQIKIQ